MAFGGGMRLMSSHLQFGNAESGLRFHDGIDEVLPEQPPRTVSTTKPTEEEKIAASEARGASELKISKPIDTSKATVTKPFQEGNSDSDDDYEVDEKDAEDDAEDDVPFTEAPKPTADDSGESSPLEDSGSDDAGDDEDKVDAEDDKAKAKGNAVDDDKDKADAEAADDSFEKDGEDAEEAEGPKETGHAPEPPRSPKRKHDEIEDPEDLPDKEAVTKEMKRMRVNEHDKSDEAEPKDAGKDVHAEDAQPREMQPKEVEEMKTAAETDKEAVDTIHTKEDATEKASVEEKVAV
ncbi:hypothetical protein CALCODRAFT_52507 [Calocera cornea HHB12733]|uniref:Uncharacterized protein n=1 Tax=Calocera cornea HHB12733 TaxID=1353952 RepID=A0A165DRZ6_9BASI|nr:hypothetical protein CALCODRAFT_52507 [Calocera cornea HHB12733]